MSREECFRGRFRRFLHEALVTKLHHILDQASEEYDNDQGVVDDFTQVVKDWATQREEGTR
jgi:hypothetical protein